MTYAVNEIFLTVQGEGANLGRVAVFCRFAGCNLWSGREEDRAAAICQFCDTDFVGGRRYAQGELADAIEAEWGAASAPRFVVFTGGEPALQLDQALVDAVRQRGFRVAVETNGTLPLPSVDWLCVSPKAGTELVQRRGDELKVVYPQPLDLAELAALPFSHLWLSPMDGPDLAGNTAASFTACLAAPQWRLNIQAHKAWGVA